MEVAIDDDAPLAEATFPCFYAQRIGIKTYLLEIFNMMGREIRLVDLWQWTGDKRRIAQKSVEVKGRI
jgi:hypothetical protein